MWQIVLRAVSKVCKTLQKEIEDEVTFLFSALSSKSSDPNAIEAFGSAMKKAGTGILSLLSTGFNALGTAECEGCSDVCR